MPFKFISGVSWGLSFPSDHTSSCELRVHHSSKQGPSFSVCFYRNHIETENFGEKWALCTWKVVWIIPAKSCTFMNHSWKLAGCSGLVTHCTQSSAPNPSLTESSGSFSVHSSRLWANAWMTSSPGSLFRAGCRWGYQGEETDSCLQGMLRLRARRRHDHRKKLHQIFCKSDSLSEKSFHSYVYTQLFYAEKKLKN